MSVMDVWFNIIMSVLVLVVVMLLMDVITNQAPTKEFEWWGKVGGGCFVFVVVNGVLYFICSVIWGL